MELSPSVPLRTQKLNRGPISFSNDLDDMLNEDLVDEEARNKGQYRMVACDTNPDPIKLIKQPT